MTTLAAHLLQQAIRLPAAERAGLADELLESLPDPHAVIDAAWLHEAEARMAAYRAGEVEAMDAKQVFAELGKTALG